MMTFTDDISLSLGTGLAGLNLHARLRDVATGAVLSGHVDISAGFTEIGDGHYLWRYASFPSDRRFVIEFYEEGQSEVLAVSSPMDAWNAGAPVDSVTQETLAEILLSYIAGTSAVTDHGNGTKTIAYSKQDGATDRLRITFDADGQWLSTDLALA